jgi:nitroreductase
MIANFSLAFSLLGEIGYRAIHFEAGRIGQALYLGSESLNYNSTGIGAFFDDDVNRFLQLREGYEVIYHFAMGKAIPDRRIRTLDGYYHLNRPEAGTTIR